jgi:DNA repair protein RecO (recombination protein O)
LPKRERIYRTEAIVLRRSDFGEADRLLTVLTPHLGKLRLLAKGARKPTSRKAGHLELFTRTQLLVARGRNLDIVTQAQTIEPHRTLRDDLWRMSHAYYVAELVDRFSEEQAENPLLYQLLGDVLDWICDSSDLALTMRFFELHMLSLVGYRPQLFECPRCSASLEPVTNYFSAEAGGVLCPRCGEGRRGLRPVSVPALKVLRYLQRRTYGQCAQLRLRPSTHAEMEELMRHYLVYTLERQLKSVEFLETLRHGDLTSPAE